MVVPCYFAFSGLWGFLYSDAPIHLRNEGLIVIALMSVYSLAVAIPYLASSYLLRRKISKRTLVITSLPFIIMLVLTTYGTYLGIPW